jgi:hypothetical protein
MQAKRRFLIIEENTPTEATLLPRVFVDQNMASPVTGEFYYFLREDGSYAAFIILTVVRREVYDSHGLLYDTYAIVSRTPAKWQPTTSFPA